MCKRLFLQCFVSITLLGCQLDKNNQGAAQELNVDGHKLKNYVEVYTTAKDSSLRLTQNETVDFEVAVQPLETEVAVFVNPNKRFQRILGFGGSITDESSEVFAKLPSNKQDKFLKRFGIGFGRF